jgi:predicted alpha/beta superfamily hydrolase
VRAYVPPALPFDIPRPVLVLFDGQNVFGDEGSYSGGWHAHAAIDRLVASRVAVAPVLVAVDHGAEERIDELGPWFDGKQGGRLDVLLDLIVGQVLPVARVRFPIVSGPEGVIVGGSSMGGLAALYAHFRRPEVFGGALCMSPSFWFARRAILRFVAEEPTPFHSRVYVDAGLGEGQGRVAPLCEELVAHLRARGWADAGPLAVCLRIDPKGTHSERHWRRRLPKALRFLFTDPPTARRVLAAPPSRRPITIPPPAFEGVPRSARR